MNIDIEKFETGWFDLFLRLSEPELDDLIANLERLKHEKDYFFNIQSNHESSDPGISNLVISLGTNGLENNAEMYPKA